MNAASDEDQEAQRHGAGRRSSTPSRVITVRDERINSRDLLASGRQITIEHGAETYFLRLTAQNKLILTK